MFGQRRNTEYVGRTMLRLELPENSMLRGGPKSKLAETHTIKTEVCGERRSEALCITNIFKSRWK